MALSNRILLSAALLGGLTAAATAQSKAAPPDPSHITFALPKDIKWGVDKSFGEPQAILFGDPAKPGPYGVLIRWAPNHMSTPHFHSTDRWVYVVSGTWWISGSDHRDPGKTFPLPAGSFATDLAGKVHWDGAKNEPVVLEVVGMGPASTVKIPRK
jgi:hypothetical protein